MTFKKLKINLNPKNSITLFLLLSVAEVLNFQASTLNADELRAHPGSIVFNALEGRLSTETRSIFIFSANGTAMSWSQTKDVTWLTADSQNGSTESVLNVGISTSGMPTGIYNGTITIQSPQSDTGPVNISVSLIINPNVPVKITTWRDGYGAAMSVSVDDGRASGFDMLQTNGFSGTYVYIGTTPPTFYPDYYNAGMELGSHLVTHPSSAVSDYRLRAQEIEPNVAGLCANTPMPYKDIISLAWPYGYTNYREQAIASEYFLSARGYNFNQLEDATPQNFMNLKSYNSHEHPPFPPSDLKTVVNLAVTQKKWFNLVLHSLNNDDGAIDFAKTKDIWVTSIGNVIKYILQRDRFILEDYSESTDVISFQASRLPIPSSPIRRFEEAFGPNDLITVQIDIDDNRSIENVLIDGSVNSYRIADSGGNEVLMTNLKLESSYSKTIEINYQSTTVRTLTISGARANNKVYDGTTAATINTQNAILVGVLGGDFVTLVSSGATGTFNDKNVGTGKIVITSGFTLSGTDAYKYRLSQPSLTASITTAELSVGGTFTVLNKVYNGTTAAIIATSNLNLINKKFNDNVTLISAANFSNKTVGIAKTVSLSSSSLVGSDAQNYVLSLTGAPTTNANITSQQLFIGGSFSVHNKVYDGNATATFATNNLTLTNKIGNDNVILNTTPYFNDKSVGTAKTVSLTGSSISGIDAQNYTLSLTDAPTSNANITVNPLRVSGVTVNNKVYDGTTSAVLSTGNASLAGVVAGEVVTLVSSGAAGIFESKDAGTAKTVLISGFRLEGNDAGNYSLTQPSLTAIISTKTLIVTANDINRPYGSENPVLSFTYSGFVNNENASILDVIPSISTNALPSSNVGTYPIVITGGSDNNYNLTLINGKLVIEKAPLTITGVDKTKLYGEPNPVLTIVYSGFVLGQTPGVLDMLPIATTDAESDSDAGSYDIIVSGAVDGNYRFLYKKGTLTIDKISQFISFPEISETLRITEEYQLNATASSGLPVIYETLNPEIGIINGNVLIIKGSGYLTIIARQAGDSNWRTAPDVSISVTTLPTFDNIMSLFTPNNDGMNDYWLIPELEQYGQSQITVYNRFGQTVYKSDSYKNDWDGTWNGRPLPSASYYYIIRSSAKGFIKGVVNIVR